MNQSNWDILVEFEKDMPFDQADMEDVNNLISEIDKGSYSLTEAKSKLNRIEK